MTQRILSTLLLFTLAAAVYAHATLVLGTLSTLPTEPRAGEPFTLQLTMTDPTGFPIEDAYVLAEFDQAADQAGEEPLSVTFEEVSAGTYATDVTLPEAGDYTLLLRDQTFRQEEAQASKEVVLGDGSLFQDGDTSIVFPPTQTTSSLQTWLIWLIALPVLAGVVVTVLVLRSSKPEEVRREE